MPKNTFSPAMAAARRWRRSLASVLLPAVASASAIAGTYTWDPSLTGTGSDGAGTWSTSVANWATGAGNISWTLLGDDIAKFGSGGTPGVVTVSGTVGVSSMLFDGAYTVNGGTIAFANSDATITSNANVTIGSAISGITTLTKAGAARLVINGATTGIGTINVSAGTLATQVSGSGSFGNSSTAINVASGAAIQVASGATAANAITFNGGSGNAAVIGGATLSGPITLASGDTKFSMNNVATISGVISGAGSLTVNGPNKLVLTGANTFSGGVTITDGVLEVSHNGSLGTGAILNNTNLTLTPGTGETITLANAMSGSGSISKSGAGKVVLSGAVSSTGYVIVSGGTLELTGAKTGTTGTNGSLFYVAGGGMLTGTGSITGAAAGALTLLAGGKLSPGLDGEIGTLTVSSFAWTSDNLTASMFFDLSTNSSASDLLAVTGAFTRSSTSGSYIFDFGGTGQEWTTYTLITYGSTTSTVITNLVGINAAYPVKFSFSGNSLQVTVVPEPSQVGLAFGLFGVLVIVMRRKRAQLAALLMKKNLLRKAQQWAMVLAVAAIGAQSATAKTVTVNLETATFDDLQAAMNAGALTSVELATLYLNRRAVYDQAGIKINSVVSISPTVMDEAQAADELRAASGQQSPVHGLFYCTKDSYPTLGMVTSGGVKSWLSSVTGSFGTESGQTWGPVVSPGDCYVVGKLKAAGAIVLGHGNMDTWATSASSTTSNAYGTTLNAYCLGSSSGSSGGPGALTGANFANFAWGGETGGSIRNPSDRAGVTGFKVSVGTNSVDHIIPLASDRDVIGPMARYAKDNAYVMDVAATTQDSNDLWASINYVPGRPLSSGYATKAANTSLAGKVIGVVGTYLGTARPSPAPTPVQLTDADVEKALGAGNGHGGILNFPTTTSSNTTSTTTNDAPVKAAHDRLVAELQAMGATVVTVFLPPNLDTAVTIPTTFTDGTATPTTALTGNNPAVTSISGIATTTATYATTTLAFENRGFMLYFGQGIYTRLTQANAASSSLATSTRGLAYDNKTSDFTVPAAVTHFQLKALYNAIFEKFMDSNGLDCLIWPVSYMKTRSSNSVNGRDLVNNMGLPACTVPIGVYPTLGGEPICEAFLGRYRKEADVLALAAAYQKEYNHRIPSPLAPPLDGETITYDDGQTTYQLRSDKTAPVVSVNSTASASGSKLVIQGIAADSSGIKSLKVYVNGRKIPAKISKRWKAAVPIAAIRKWSKPKAKTVEVTVLAKDKAGNASGIVKNVKI